METSNGVEIATLRGRVKRKDHPIVSVGDLVELERHPEGGRVSGLLPRTSALTRHGIARRREQVIVANVDQVAVVISAGSPEPDFLMVDRLLVLAELNEIPGVVVLNKIELRAGPDPDPVEDPRLAPYRAAGYDILATSAKTGEGLDRFADRLHGRITVLSGQSGVGKSSLLNALDPGLDLRVGAVGERKGRGRHTTVSAALYPFPGGGHVADTPGLQYLALWNVAPVELAAAFPDLARLAGGCRFSDCRHREEPGCEVIAARDGGKVDPRRYESYLGLLAEAEKGS